MQDRNERKTEFPDEAELHAIFSQIKFEEFTKFLPFFHPEAAFNIARKMQALFDEGLLEAHKQTIINIVIYKPERIEIFADSLLLFKKNNLLAYESYLIYTILESHSTHKARETIDKLIMLASKNRLEPIKHLLTDPSTYAHLDNVINVMTQCEAPLLVKELKTDILKYILQYPQYANDIFFAFKVLFMCGLLNNKNKAFLLRHPTLIKRIAENIFCLHTANMLHRSRLERDKNKPFLTCSPSASPIVTLDEKKLLEKNRNRLMQHLPHAHNLASQFLDATLTEEQKDLLCHYAQHTGMANALKFASQHPDILSVDFLKTHPELASLTQFYDMFHEQAKLQDHLFQKYLTDYPTAQDLRNILLWTETLATIKSTYPDNSVMHETLQKILMTIDIKHLGTLKNAIEQLLFTTLETHYLLLIKYPEHAQTLISAMDELDGTDLFQKYKSLFETYPEHALYLAKILFLLEPQQLATPANIQKIIQYRQLYLFSDTTFEILTCQKQFDRIIDYIRVREETIKQICNNKNKLSMTLPPTIMSTVFDYLNLTPELSNTDRENIEKAMTIDPASEILENAGLSIYQSYIIDEPKAALDIAKNLDKLSKYFNEKDQLLLLTRPANVNKLMHCRAYLYKVFLALKTEPSLDQESFDRVTTQVLEQETTKLLTRAHKGEKRQGLFGKLPLQPNLLENILSFSEMKLSR